MNYSIDLIAKDIEKSAILEVLAEKKPFKKAIKSIKLHIMNEDSMLPDSLILSYSEEVCEDHLYFLNKINLEKSALKHIYGDDDILYQFCEKNNLDHDDFQWGDTFLVPMRLLNYELLMAAQNVKEALKEEGIVFSEDARECIGGHDEEEEDPDLESIKEEISDLISDDIRKEFSSLFYHDECKQNMLLSE